MQRYLIIIVIEGPYIASSSAICSLATATSIRAAHDQTQGSRPGETPCAGRHTGWYASRCTIRRSGVSALCIECDCTELDYLQMIFPLVVSARTSRQRRYPGVPLRYELHINWLFGFSIFWLIHFTRTSSAITKTAPHLPAHELATTDSNNDPEVGGVGLVGTGPTHSEESISTHCLIPGTPGPFVLQCSERGRGQQVPSSFQGCTVPSDTLHIG